MLAFFYYADVVLARSKVVLDTTHLIEGAYCAFAVMISMGIWLGKIETPYLLIAVTIEVIAYALNHFIGVYKLGVVNPGYSIFVHVFGAFFGGAFSLVAQTAINVQRTAYEYNSTYNHERWTWLGALFLWVLFPSYNAALAPDGTQLQAAVNTFLCQVVTTGSAFAVNRLFFHKGKFTGTDLRNAALVGGLIMSSAANMTLPQYLSMPIGIFTGILAVFFIWMLDKLHRLTGINDSSYSFAVHGVFGVIAAFIGMAATGNAKNHGTVFAEHYSQMFASNVADQGTHQLASFVITLGIASAGGLLAGTQELGIAVNVGVGAAVKIARLGKRIGIFYDNKEWKVPEDYPAVITRDATESSGKA